MYFIYYYLDNPSRRNRMGLNHPTVSAVHRLCRPSLPSIARRQSGPNQSWNKCCSRTTGLGCSIFSCNIHRKKYSIEVFFWTPPLSIKRSLNKRLLDCKLLLLNESKMNKFRINQRSSNSITLLLHYIVYKGTPSIC